MSTPIECECSEWLTSYTTKVEGIPILGKSAATIKELIYEYQLQKGKQSLDVNSTIKNTSLTFRFLVSVLTKIVICVKHLQCSVICSILPKVSDIKAHSVGSFPSTARFLLYKLNIVNVYRMRQHRHCIIQKEWKITDIFRNQFCTTEYIIVCSY